VNNEILIRHAQCWRQDIVILAPTDVKGHTNQPNFDSGSAQLAFAATKNLCIAGKNVQDVCDKSL